MPALPIQIDLPAGDRAELERVVRARSAERRMVERARIILLAAEALPATEIAARVGCDKNTVNKWRSRYVDGGMDGLSDLPRHGGLRVHGHEARARLIAKACTRPAPLDNGQRRERWTYAELAAEAGMSVSHAHSILKAADVKPHLVAGTERVIAIVDNLNTHANHEVDVWLADHLVIALNSATDLAPRLDDDVIDWTIERADHPACNECGSGRSPRSGSVGSSSSTTRSPQRRSRPCRAGACRATSSPRRRA